MLSYRAFNLNQFLLKNKKENNSNEHEYDMPSRKGHRRKKRFKGISRPPAWPVTLWYTSTRTNPVATWPTWQLVLAWSKVKVRIFLWPRTEYHSSWSTSHYAMTYTAVYYDDNFLSYYTELLKKRSQMDNIFDKMWYGPAYGTIRRYKVKTTTWANYLLKYSPGSLGKDFEYKRVSTDIILYSILMYDNIIGEIKAARLCGLEQLERRPAHWEVKKVLVVDDKGTN